LLSTYTWALLGSAKLFSFLELGSVSRKCNVLSRALNELGSSDNSSLKGIGKWRTEPGLTVDERGIDSASGAGEVHFGAIVRWFGGVGIQDLEVKGSNKCEIYNDEMNELGTPLIVMVNLLERRCQKQESRA
jgi:hypothetical protein